MVGRDNIYNDLVQAKIWVGTLCSIPRLVGILAYRTNTLNERECAYY